MVALTEEVEATTVEVDGAGQGEPPAPLLLKLLAACINDG